MTQVSYPRLSARTQRFTLGRPRSFTISPDGSRVVFVRSPSGTNRAGQLWSLDVASGNEQMLVDPSLLLSGNSEELSAQERARRERMRESASGVVGYATNRDVTTAVLTLSGRLFFVDLLQAEVRELAAAQTPAIDPRLDPAGQLVAYACNGSLRVLDISTSDDRELVGSDSADVVWGQSDFLASEELDRSRGFWWSPDGSALIVERYDESGVQEWYVSNPTQPDQPCTRHRYPAAGTPNPAVSLWLVTVDGEVTQISYDEHWEYVSAVNWSVRGKPLVQVLDRLQKNAAVLEVNDDGSSHVVRLQTDSAWVDVKPGVPTWGPQGQLLTIEAVDDRYALCVDGEPVTGPDLQVSGVIDVGPDDVLIVGSEHPTEQHIYRWSSEGVVQVTTTSGVHAAIRGGPTVVSIVATLDEPQVIARYSSPLGSGTVRSVAEIPALRPNVTVLSGGSDDLRVAVVMPSRWQPGVKLPVLMDPYGGPHGQMVLRTQGAFRDSQWFADQGFAVVVVDGRGTPGSPLWERAIRHDLAEVVLSDQVSGLHAAAHAFPDLDLSAVAIRGWSFGGYLAALAVLERPDVFHAAVAGAPVTDWRLYDTAYTERYLGLLADNPGVYDATSLLTKAAKLSRPLQIIHGFADDNVFVANSLQLSQTLTENGRPHQVVPLTGITHMASQEEVAESLLLMQVDFLRQTVGVGELP
ncbi:MAG: prolyl oligopeptidase family serine peptidase [Candidatus Nanopelagicales bacterium]